MREESFQRKGLLPFLRSRGLFPAFCFRRLTGATGEGGGGGEGIGELGQEQGEQGDRVLREAGAEQDGDGGDEKRQLHGVTLLFFCVVFHLAVYAPSPVAARADARYLSGELFRRYRVPAAPAGRPETAETTERSRNSGSSPCFAGGILPPHVVLE